MSKRISYKVQVGSQFIGGDAKILIQSMTNTETSNVDSTVNQIIELHEAGSEIVRITVNDPNAAQAVSKIYDRLLAKNLDIPLVGCFHYNGHQLLSDYPDLCFALAKYRINPGNVGFGSKRDKQFEIMIEKAIEYNKPVRIGVNWGSIDADLSAKIMDDNAKKAQPLSSKEVLHQVLVQSCLINAKKAEEIGLGADKIILSCKVSQPLDLIEVYKSLSEQCKYALHLGLTEAGMGMKGIVASTAALSPLLLEGIGDTIRVSITPAPGESRTKEVEICKQILQSLDLRRFMPEVSSCPGCGRTSSGYFVKLANEIEDYIKLQMPIWQQKYPGVESLKIAVMGCIVNGPGESKHADIGISLPGSGESPVAPVFIDGEKKYTLRGEDIAAQFKEILNNYVGERFVLVNN